MAQRRPLGSRMAQRKASGGEVIGDHYPTISSVLDVVDGPVYGGASSHRTSSNSERWTLGLDWEETIDAYVGGWAEGAQKVYELAESIKMVPTATRQSLKRSVVGGHANVGAYLAGSPVNMWQVARRDAQGKPFVHLYCQLNYLAAVDASTGFDRGCALVAMADALENAGCRVRITGVDHTNPVGGTSAGKMYCSTYGLKEYGERLDVDNIIFTLAHPAFYRRIAFAIRESTYGEAEGSTVDAPESIMEVDGLVHNVLFRALMPIENGKTPEMFLKQMIASLPESVREWIETEED